MSKIVASILIDEKTGFVVDVQPPNGVFIVAFIRNKVTGYITDEMLEKIHKIANKNEQKEDKTETL